MFDAIYRGDLATVQNLAQAQPKLISQPINESGGTPLEWAAMYGRLEIAKFLLAKGAAVVPLWNAPTKEMAELLLTHGAEVNQPNANGGTPLLSAASWGRPDVVEFLLAHGADISLRYKNGSTPLGTAAAGGLNDGKYLKVAELLLKAGDDINAVCAEGQTPLHIATNYSRKLEMVNLLLAHGANANVSDKYGQTPLHRAVLDGRKDMTESLLAHGASANVKDNHGKTPWQWAVIHNETEIAQFLRRHGAKECAQPTPVGRVMLSPELVHAAKLLEQKLHAAGTKTRKVSFAEWSQVPLDLHDLIPRWLPTLLADFSLHGGVFELPNHDKDRTWPLWFMFLGPGEYKSDACGKSRYCFVDEFIADGFNLISSESDGNMWVAGIADLKAVPVYFFDQSAHERIQVAEDITQLMMRMNVSGS